MTPTDPPTSDRRRFLQLVGGGGLVAGAGCVGQEDEQTETSPGGGGGGTPTATATATTAAPDEVVFGQPASLTGKWDFLQPAVSQSTDLALTEIEEAGGPLGATVTLERRDTAVKPQQARTVVQQLVNNDDARVLLGLFSSEIVPLWDLLQEQRTPIVTPWPGTTFLDTRGGDNDTPADLSDDGWVWRTVIGDTVHTAGAAKAMIDEGFESMGILNGTSAGERGWADQFVEAYRNLGGTVAKRVEVSEGQSSYQSSLDVLFKADFDAWGLAVALEDATTIIRDWANAGYGRQLLLEDGLMDQNLVEAVGDRAEGALIAAGSTRGPNYDQFIEKFESFGDADLHPWGVAAYDATNIAALAVHSAGSASRSAIQRNVGAVAREPGTRVTTFAEGKEALDAGEEINYEGAVTPSDFTKFGNVWGDVAVSAVTPDGFEQRNTIAADTLKETIETY